VCGAQEGGGNHARKRRVAGHVRALLSRADATTQEVRSLHAFCKAIEAAMVDDKL
jgi:tRNA C32,U32 (ribose-2'-O)-methylase TrmJ